MRRPMDSPRTMDHTDTNVLDVNGSNDRTHVFGGKLLGIRVGCFGSSCRGYNVLQQLKGLTTKQKNTHTCGVIDTTVAIHTTNALVANGHNRLMLATGTADVEI